jgi:hypothetical protein
LLLPVLIRQGEQERIRDQGYSENELLLIK